MAKKKTAKKPPKKPTPAGRNKVVNEHRKNVHAGISGYPVNEQEMRDFHLKLSSHARKVKYNPYVHSFVHTLVIREVKL